MPKRQQTQKGLSLVPNGWAAPVTGSSRWTDSVVTLVSDVCRGLGRWLEPNSLGYKWGN